MSGFQNPTDNGIRRRILSRYTIMAMLAYQFSFGVVFLSKILILSRDSLKPIILCYFAFTSCSLCALIFIRLKKEITKAYIFFILHFQSVICILVATYLFYEMSNQRYLVLIGCEVILMFVFIQSTFRVSLFTILFVITGYLVASYIGIVQQKQPGSFLSEILYILIFIPVSVFIAYMSVRMQDQKKEIKKANTTLRSTHAELESAHRELENVHGELETQTTKMIESIKYAELIQRSLLPGIERIKTTCPDSMIIWMPKDIVGGDIFYTYSDPEQSIIALMDCTGHGVPGAFLTMIAYSEIRKIIMDDRHRTPSDILKYLNLAVKNVLYRNENGKMTDDGLDASVCMIDTQKRTVTFSGARIPLFLVHDGEVKMIKGDRQSIGYNDTPDDFKFTDHVIHVGKNSVFFMKTDGYTDQLGSGNRIRLGTKKFMQLILEHSEKPCLEQRHILLRELNAHKGDHEQIDDITLIGFRVVDEPARIDIDTPS
jgi:serine phosphatase RsbU (regulator of sigma subunit)